MGRSRPTAEDPAAQALATPEEAALQRNIVLLGVPEAEGAKGLGLTSRTLFRKPNNKALEVILYHVYSTIRGKAAAKKVRWLCQLFGQVCLHFGGAVYRLDRTQTPHTCSLYTLRRSPTSTQHFKGMWPIQDKKQQKDFYQVRTAHFEIACIWLKNKPWSCMRPCAPAKPSKLKVLYTLHTRTRTPNHSRKSATGCGS